MPRRVLGEPEPNVVIFSFLLNFVWELWQVPFFAFVPAAPHWEGILTCTRATLGDAGISLFAFWVAALAVRSRSWIEQGNRTAAALFLGVGVAVTVLVEWLATEVLSRWSYAPSMPVLPWIGTGLLPLLQWLIVPPVVLWFVRRQRP